MFGPPVRRFVLSSQEIGIHQPPYDGELVASESGGSKLSQFTVPSRTDGVTGPQRWPSSIEAIGWLDG